MEVFIAKVEDKQRYYEICLDNKFLDEGDLYPQNAHLFDIRRNDEHIGYASIEYKEDVNAVCIWGFYVEPEFRGKGWGTEAFYEVLEKARALFPNATPYVNVMPNNKRAQHIYLKFGAFVYVDDKATKYVSPIGEYQIVFNKRGVRI